MQPAPALTFVTDIASPYQLELMLAVRDAYAGPVRVIFCRHVATLRQWQESKPDFDHCFLDSGGGAQALQWTQDSGLVVFCGYAQIGFQRLMWRRAWSRKPWAFWGERPGANHRGIAGRAARRLAQLPNKLSRVPVWGIGSWAAEGYSAELGANRLYLNVPYYSDLSRFAAIARPDAGSNDATRFLFSGMLIERKGVDLLAQAFSALRAEGVSARLSFLGAGPLEQSLRHALAPVSDSVAFLGFRQWSELPQVYASHDVLCAPSRYDGWGLIVPEGLAAGMPVIATDAMGAARDLINPGNGWLARAGDLSTLLAAMRVAAGLPEAARRQMSAAASASACAQHVDAGAARVLDAAAQTLSACAKLGMHTEDHNRTPP